MADPLKQWANAKLGKKPPGKGFPPKAGGPPAPGGAPPPGGPPKPPMGAAPPGGAPPSHPAALPPGAPPAPPAPHPPPTAAPVAPPDIRVAQLTWLTPEQQAELQGNAPDPPPTWIDPMKWEQAKVQIGQAWQTLPEPRAVATFFVHQAEQTAKAAMPPGMPPAGAPPAPGAPPAGGAPPPPHPGPPRF